MVKIHNITQGSQEWLELREGLYTGSNADKLLRFGKIPYSTSATSGFVGNFYTKRGHLLEDEAIELYEQIKGVKVNRAGFVTNTLYPNCGYSPDGLLPDRTIECKAFKKDLHLATAKEPDFKVLAQCHFGKVITGLKLTDLLLYNPDIEEPADRLIIVTIPYKPAIMANIKRIIKA